LSVAKMKRSRGDAGGSVPPRTTTIRAGDPVAVESDPAAVESPPVFEELRTKEAVPVQYRKVRIPAHRYTPLKKQWAHVIKPLTEKLKLQVRFNPRSRCVELKSCEATIDAGAIQKGADYAAAFAMGFDVVDAVALLRLEDLFVDSFQVKDVKILHGDHLSRAVGRLAGADGKTRYAIENATRTRIVIADTHIHILGSTANIKVARDAICDLIMGSPPGKVYNRMRTVAKRLSVART